MRRGTGCGLRDGAGADIRDAPRRIQGRPDRIPGSLRSRPGLRGRYRVGAACHPARHPRPDQSRERHAPWGSAAGAAFHLTAAAGWAEQWRHSATPRHRPADPRARTEPHPEHHARDPAARNARWQPHGAATLAKRRQAMIRQTGIAPVAQDPTAPPGPPRPQPPTPRPPEPGPDIPQPRPPGPDITPPNPGAPMPGPGPDIPRPGTPGPDIPMPDPAGPSPGPGPDVPPLAPPSPQELPPPVA